MEKPINVDDFIENAVTEAQPILREFRKMIMDTFPEVEEKIGYGVPQYKYRNNSLGMSVAKKHVTLGFDYATISDEMRKQLEEKGYKLGLQTMQIKFGQVIPKDEILDIFNKIIQNSK
jgi:uncharacterized protein YdhG (YjbR/CyaY superfamily)